MHEQCLHRAHPCRAWTAGTIIVPGGNCDANGNFSAAQGVNFPQIQDPGIACPGNNEAFEDAYFFMHEGLPMVYSDGFNHNTPAARPIASFANYLGEFGDNTMPDNDVYRTTSLRAAAHGRAGATKIS